jgi:hypothetical protein
MTDNHCSFHVSPSGILVLTVVTFTQPYGITTQVEAFFTRGLPMGQRNPAVKHVYEVCQSLFICPCSLYTTPVYTELSLDFPGHFVGLEDRVFDLPYFRTVTNVIDFGCFSLHLLEERII